METTDFTLERYVFKGRLENNTGEEEEINIRMLHLNMEIYIHIYKMA